MKNILFILLVLVSVCMLSTSVNADPWLDKVLYYNDVSPFEPQGTLPEEVLGEPEAALTLSTGDELIVAFTNNYAFDGPGDDILIYENVDASGGNETVDVYASLDNVFYVYLGEAENDEAYDLSNYEELDSIKYLKFIGNSLGGSSPGHELQAVEALNSADNPVWPTAPPAEASTVYGHKTANKSNIMNLLSIVFVPIGAVFFMRIIRRKK